jgi:pimeloyl-ACP methyl ester carboxylesterase
MIAIAPSTSIPYQKQTWFWQGHKIQYTCFGYGEPLLLIHGFGASIDHWRKNIPVLADAGYRVWAIDLLGFGGSEKAPRTYGIELWQELIVDFHRELIGVPTVFIGNSIGALLALSITANYPEIAKAGTIINCAGGLSHRSTDLNPLLSGIMTVFTQLVTSPLSGPWIFDFIRQKSTIRRNLGQVYFRKEAITEELVEIIYQPACDPGAQQVFASIISAAPGPEIGELLTQLDRPLLVLWGDRDPWTPIKGMQDFTTAAAGGKEITTAPIPDAGHCPHDEYPELVNPAILNWLAALQSA